MGPAQTQKWRRLLVLLCIHAALISSLPHKVHAALQDTAQLNTALRNAQQLVSTSPEKASSLAKSVAGKAARAGDKKLEAQAYTICGLVAGKQGEYDSASLYHNKALALRRKASLFDEADESLMHLAAIESNKGNNEQALQLLLDALTHQEKQGTPRVKAQLMNELGKLHDQMKQYPKALEYLQQARVIFQELNDERNLAENSLQLGNLYTVQGELNTAKDYYQHALDYFSSEQDLHSMANCYTNLANIHLQQKKEAIGLQLYQKALVLYERLGSKIGQISVLNNLALYYDADMHQPARALPYYKRAYELAHKTGNKAMEMNIAGNLYLLYKDLPNADQAIIYLERYAELQDSLINESRVKQIAELQERYEADKRARQIVQLRNENQLKEAHASRRTWERNVSIAAGILLIGVALMFIRHYRQKQRSAQLLAEKNQELNQKRVQELLRKQEVATLHAHLEGQEEERKRIAQDLHDRLGGLLATVKLYFQVARTPEQMDKTSELLDAACQEVRQIAHNMASGVLMKFGLVAALQSLAESITNSGQLKMHTNFYSLDNRLDSHVEVTLYRILQELVSNTLRHAHATEVTLQLTRHHRSLSLIMEDNGRGFNPDEITPGMGLDSIAMRVEQLNGKLTIDSGRGNGTTVIIDIPLPPARPISAQIPSIITQHDSPPHS